MNRAMTIRGYRLGFAALTFAAVAWQWIDGRDNPGFSIANFFSFFTIQSNLLAATVLLLLAIIWQDEHLPGITMLRGAAVAYMTTTGVVYAVLLSSITEELGTVIPWVNTVVHQLMPVVMVLDWIIVQPRYRLEFRRCLIWMVYPFAFLVYSLIRGPIVDWYPYPFLNPGKSGGYPGVTAYAIGIAIGFAGFVWLIVTLGNRPWQQPAPALQEAP
jgi:hypothetical protein